MIFLVFFLFKQMENKRPKEEESEGDWYSKHDYL